MPGADYYVKQNDTASAIALTLENDDGTPVNLTGASVKFVMKPIAGGAAKVNAAATIADAAAGQVTYSWSAGDTDTAGLFLGEIQVTYSTGRVQTFPNSGYIRIRITPELGS